MLRRSMRSTLSFLVLVACSHQPPPAGAIHAFKIGALDAVALLDGTFTVPNDGKTVGLGRPAAEVGDLLAAAGEPRDPVAFSIQPLLVKDGAHVLLFDTGAAAATWARGGLLPRSLALAGVAPEAVTDIFISHGDPDHIGGLITGAGALAFPNATVHLTSPEWALVQKHEDSKQIAAAIAAKVAPFEPGAQLLPGVTAIATPGHTAGHSSYEITSGGDKLFYLGDVAHQAVISVQRPAWSIEFDRDPPAAEAMRQQTLAKLAAEGEHVFAVHFPFPGLGHIRTHDATFTWQRD
jgi:glyoxylase-like metal-dependent hydrolase (beta-lactamase superfamily II)